MPTRSIHADDRGHASATLEALEPRLLFTAVPLITEFLASNSDGLLDEDGDSSDWLELYNAGDSALDLKGWHLTDDAGELDKWAFPSVTLEAGQYLVVFASDKDRSEADGTELHTNFRIGAGGEYLALVEADGATVAFEYAPEFPPQSSDISFGLSMASTTTSLIADGGEASYLVPGGTVAGWETLGFNDSGWSVGPTGIGYAPANDPYQAYIETPIGGGVASLYTRQSFNITDPDAIDTLELGVRFEDGFIAYLNGVRVAEGGINVPANPSFNSTLGAGNERDELAAVEFEPYDLGDYIDLLVAGENVLAIQAINVVVGSSDLLIEAELTAVEVTSVDAGVRGFMVTPTPGAANVFGGPVIESVTDAPGPLAVGQDLVVEASVSENTGNGLDRVELHYRINFDNEFTVQAFDNGLGADALAGDGVFTATISASNYSAGDMVRWYVTAEDDLGNTSRAPVFLDQTGTRQHAEYFGTVVAGGPESATLPTFLWFVEDTEWYFSQEADQDKNNDGRIDYGKYYTRGAVYYNGEFYDNVGIRIRGASSVFWSFPKQSLKLKFSSEHLFEYRPDRDRVSDININALWLDQDYIHNALAMEIYQAAGVPAPDTHFAYSVQNGAFHSVVSIVEQVDEDFLERNGLDPDGALYKVYNALQNANDRPEPPIGVQPDNFVGVEKKTRENEDNSDLQAFIDGLELSNVNDRVAYIFDSVDVPSVLSYLAASVIIRDRDMTTKNWYVHRNTTTDGEWQAIPWDRDISFGYQGFLNPGGSPGTSINALYLDNRTPLHDAIYDTPILREMYLRRLRTVLDTLLMPPGTPTAELPLEARVDEYLALLQTDVAADKAMWGVPTIFGGNYDPNETLAQSLAVLKSYLAGLRNNIYSDGLLPSAQPTSPSLTIEVIEHTPAGDQDREYIQITNNNSFAIDISGWTVEGGIGHVFSGGTVIAAGASLYLTPSSNAFRARPSGPSGGQGLFVQQWDSGHLSSFGETVTILRIDGSVAASKSYTGTPSPEQSHLRVTELHYNPSGPSAAEQSAGFSDGDQFEFIELVNTSATETLDLAGVGFSNGIQATFSGGSQTILATDFDTGTNGFGFINNAFNGTAEVGTTAGERDVTGGVGGGGALRIDLLSADSGPDHGPTSAAYNRLVTLAQPGEVTISFDYRFVFEGGFESSEFGQAIAELNGQRLGTDSDGSLWTFTGDGNNGPASDTGWVGFSTTVALGAGNHVLALGAYYNQSTFTNEGARVWFDNLSIQAPVDPVSLAPGERALLVADLAAFTQRYGQQVVDGAAHVITYTGNLANNGERIKLNDVNGSTILDFVYEDGTGRGEEAWPTTPDGGGPSLVVVDVEGDYDAGGNWVASTTVNGTPGQPEAAGLTGDITGDGFVGAEDLDQLLAYWGDAAASSPQAAAADLDDSGTVGGTDLAIVLANWGNGTPSSVPTSNGETPTDTPDANPSTGTPPVAQSSGTPASRGGQDGATAQPTAPSRPQGSPSPTHGRPAAEGNTPSTRTPDLPSRQDLAAQSQSADRPRGQLAAMSRTRGVDALSLTRPKPIADRAAPSDMATRTQTRVFDALTPHPRAR